MNIETVQTKGKTVQIKIDEFPDDPREWDNLGTMICFHRRYNVGDKHDYQNPQLWQMAMVESVIDPWNEEIAGDRVVYWNDDALYEDLPAEVLEEIWNIIHQHYIILPIWGYDHGGLAIKTCRSGQFADPWDSGMLGYIYVSKKQVKEEYNWKYLTAQRIEKIKSYLRSEVEIYDYYLQGRVYGYVSTCDLCGEEDSCWGFYGEEWKENGLMDYIDGYCQCVERQYNQLVAIRD